MKELTPSQYIKKVEYPQERVYELYNEEDMLGFGLAIADIEQSIPHVHHVMREIYVVLENPLEVNLNGETRRLEVGEILEIPPNTVHSARTMTDDRSRIAVFSIPAWTPEDHQIVEGNTP